MEQRLGHLAVWLFSLLVVGLAMLLAARLLLPVLHALHAVAR